MILQRGVNKSDGILFIAWLSFIVGLCGLTACKNMCYCVLFGTQNNHLKVHISVPCVAAIRLHIEFNIFSTIILPITDSELVMSFV